MKRRNVLMVAMMAIVLVFSILPVYAHEDIRTVTQSFRVPDEAVKKAFQAEENGVDHKIIDGISVFYVDSEDDIDCLEVNPDLPFLIVIRNGAPSRNICPECGYNTMRLRTWEQHTRTKIIMCPLEGGAYPDHAIRMDQFYGDYCSNCGQLNQTSSGHYYLVQCSNGTVGDPDYYVVGDGYDPHELLSFSF